MHDGNVSVFDLEDQDLSCLDRVTVVVGEEQKVTTIERWLHTTTVCACVHVCVQGYQITLISLLQPEGEDRKNVTMELSMLHLCC